MTFFDALKREFSFIKGNYAVLVTSWILIDFAMEIPGTYYSLYVLGLGATETVLGLIGFSTFLALASLQFPGGYLADKFGRRWLVASMTFGVGLSFIIFAIAPSWELILFGSVLMAIFNSIYQPALMAMIADSLPSERRGMGFGIITLITSASTTPGPVVAGVLRNSFGLMDGMRVAYGIVVVLFLIAAFLRLFKLKETMLNVKRPSLKEIFSSYPISLKESFGVWKKVPHATFYLFLALIMITFGFSTTNLYLVVYAVRELGIDEATWPLILTALFITMITVSIPMGKIVDKVNRKSPILLSFILFGLSMWLFLNGNLILLFVSLVLAGLAQVTIMSAVSALQADLTPKEQRGKVGGFTNFASQICMAVGSFTGGFLYEHISPRAPFYIAIFSILPAFLLTLFLVHEPEKREE